MGTQQLGLVPGGETTSHAGGNDILYKVDGGTDKRIEGDEYHICAKARQSSEIIELKNMTAKEILDHIYTVHGCHVTPGKAEGGDFIVCKLVVRDETKRNITGTVNEILNILQSEKSCNVTIDCHTCDQMEEGGDIYPYNKYAVCTDSISKTGGTPKRSEWDAAELERYESCLSQVEKKMEKGGDILTLKDIPHGAYVNAITGSSTTTYVVNDGFVEKFNEEIIQILKHYFFSWDFYSGYTDHKREYIALFDEYLHAVLLKNIWEYIEFEKVKNKFAFNLKIREKYKDESKSPSLFFINQIIPVPKVLVDEYKAYRLSYAWDKNPFEWAYSIQKNRMDHGGAIDPLHGGASDGYTIGQIETMHGMEPGSLTKQYESGIRDEFEHTDNPEVAAKIARDHLYLDPDAYKDENEDMPSQEMKNGGILDIKPIQLGIIPDYEDSLIMAKGGSIDFNDRDMPSKSAYEYAYFIKTNHPKLWNSAANVMGNTDFIMLSRILERGYWLPSEENDYIIWKEYRAIKQDSERKDDVLALLKRLAWPSCGEAKARIIIGVHEDSTPEVEEGYIHAEMMADGGEVEGKYDLKSGTVEILDLNTDIGEVEEKLASSDEKIKSTENKINEIIQRERSENLNLFEQKSLLRQSVGKFRSDQIALKNIQHALSNGGRVVSITDMKGLLHENVADFRDIPALNISFEEDSILDNSLPIYIPIIDMESFRTRGYVFDAMRIGEDTYIMALAKHVESGSNYVLLTLDQLVLTSDYYFKLAKAKNALDAKRKNDGAEERWDLLPEEKRERFLNQKGLWHSLPATVKKKINQADYESLDWREKEKIYKFYKRNGAKRLTSKLEETEMWVSTHSMYERFVNPEAKLVIYDKKKYGSPEVFSYWYKFREMLDFKIKDIKIQRDDLADNRRLAVETSFGMSNASDVLLDKYGILVKRQDGSTINPVDIEQVRAAWESVNNTFGNLRENALQYGLKISHTGKTNVFASRAVGIYIPSMGTIAVSDKFGDKGFRAILSHEVAHLIDNKIGLLENKRYATDDYESTAGRIAFTFRKNMNEKSESNYTNATKECFARAMEQYYAVTEFGDGAILGFEKTYFSSRDYVGKDFFYSTLKPMVKTFLSENEGFFSLPLSNNSHNIEVEPDLLSPLQTELENIQFLLGLEDDASKIKVLQDEIDSIKFLISI